MHLCSPGLMKCTTLYVLSCLGHCFRVSVSSIIKYVFMSKNAFDESEISLVEVRRDWRIRGSERFRIIALFIHLVCLLT